jgi:hypothetical protein
LHKNPQLLPSHVATPFVGGVAQGEHDAPHEVMLVLLTQVPPQRWYPATHVNPQAPPVHVGIAFGGAVHATLHEPQKSGFVFVSTQSAPQRVGVLPPQPLEHPKLEPITVHTGVAPEQTRPHMPQSTAVERSTSHPVAAMPSQSANPAAHV